MKSPGAAFFVITSVVAFAGALIGAAFELDREPFIADGYVVDAEFATTLGVLAFIADFCFGLMSFGVGICFQMCWQIAAVANITNGTVKDAIKYYSVQCIVIAGTQAIRLRANLDFQLFCYIGIPAAVSAFLGIRLLIILKNVWLKRALGIFFLFLALRLTCKCCKETKADKQQQAKVDAAGKVLDMSHPVTKLLVRAFAEHCMF
jgi:uncharacterized membrane protein YfcA